MRAAHLFGLLASVGVTAAPLPATSVRKERRETTDFASDADRERIEAAKAKRARKAAKRRRDAGGTP